MKFTCTFQLSTHDRNEFEEMGPVTEDLFIKIFKDFTWEEEVAQAAAFRKAVPMLSVIDDKGDALWVSAHPDSQGDLEYVIHLEHGMDRSFLGLFNWKSREVLQKETSDPRIVEMLISDFFAWRWYELRQAMQG